MVANAHAYNTNTVQQQQFNGRHYDNDHYGKWTPVLILTPGKLNLRQLIRPPDIVCRRTYILPGILLSFFFFFSFFVSYSLSSLNGTKPCGQMVRSRLSVIWKCMSEIWGIPSPNKPGAPKPRFRPTSQLTGNLNGDLYLRNETRYRQSVKCVDKYKGSPTSSRNVINFGPQTA